MPKNIRSQCTAFTLIELSIVLVIIGLVVGAILTGQTLIASAAVQNQIGQIQAYQSATNTFKLKYAYLPGDIPSTEASRFGFGSRGSNPGQGDGNGVIESYLSGVTSGLYHGLGETAVFWCDLTRAKLIDGNFTTATSAWLNYAYDITLSSSPSLNNFLPEAKIGRNNFIYAYSSQSKNFLGISIVSDLASGYATEGAVGMKVKEAHAIDKKIDDSTPNAGKVIAQYIGFQVLTQPGYANPDTSGTCYNQVTKSYSIGINNGENIRCAISVLLE